MRLYKHGKSALLLNFYSLSLGGKFNMLPVSDQSGDVVLSVFSIKKCMTTFYTKFNLNYYSIFHI